jgi:Threonine dehydrogenase and related Zn-dependent dehydrogenases
MPLTHNELVMPTRAEADSMHGWPVTAFPHDAVVRNDVRIMGVRGHDHHPVVSAIELIRSGRYQLKLLASHRFPLERVDEALYMADAAPTHRPCT